MQIISLFIVGLVAGHSGDDGHDLSDQGRFHRAIGLLETWIESNMPEWKRARKLRTMLDWMEHRLTHNLNDDCTHMPSQDDLEDLDQVCNMNPIEF